MNIPEFSVGQVVFRNWRDGDVVAYKIAGPAEQTEDGDWVYPCVTSSDGHGAATVASVNAAGVVSHEPFNYSAWCLYATPADAARAFMAEAVGKGVELRLRASQVFNEQRTLARAVDRAAVYLKAAP